MHSRSLGAGEGGEHLPSKCFYSVNTETLILRCVIPVVLSQEQANWYIRVCISSNNYILGSMFTNTKVQLHVSAVSVGHLQVVHEELINKLYQLVWGVYRLWGRVGARSRLCRRKGRGLGLFRGRVKVTSMSTYSYV